MDKLLDMSYYICHRPTIGLKSLNAILPKYEKYNFTSIINDPRHEV